jgi:glycerol-3-phosphate dehydrogenase
MRAICLNPAASPTPKPASWLPADLAGHYGRLYGTRAERLLAGASDLDALGRHFGATLYEREARFLMRDERAETSEDILERRTKHGLHLDAGVARRWPLARAATVGRA